MIGARVCSTDSEPIHLWFNLTYSSYLVLQRTLLQSMPTEWQVRFVRCLEELDAAFGDQMPDVSYSVRTRIDGKYAHDPLADYQRGRRTIQMTKAARQLYNELTSEEP